VNDAATGRPITSVVEDIPILRLMAVDVVDDAGFEAIEAGNADEASTIFEPDRGAR
jgi:hypothetical protein